MILMKTFDSLLCDGLNAAKYSFVFLETDLHLPCISSNIFLKQCSLILMALEFFSVGFIITKTRIACGDFCQKIVFQRAFSSKCFPVDVLLWSILIIYYKILETAVFLCSALTKRTKTYQNFIFGWKSVG